MKNFKKILCMALCTACLSGMAVTGASADNELVYGTMNIPYDKFYANEGVSYEVDAVSSATTGKWKNENLVAGTYNSENSDGTGTILGVTYNVAVTRETLNALGDDNYNFTPSETTPQAYKLVTLNGDTADFSAVVGETATAENIATSITANSVWGDYQITVDAINNNQGTSDFGRIYGVLLTTTDGDKYALRHLQNIWRDELAWSSGIKTSEPHGNNLDYEDYVSIMGQTIDKITYITETGYHIVDTDLYVPVKFNGAVEVSDATVDAGETTFETTGFPEDYQKAYSIVGLTSEITDGVITYSSALPGSYTIEINDVAGIYADMYASFVLSTDSVPVRFDGTKLAVADNFNDSDFENYIKNIATVTVGENAYSASGRGSVAIIGEDGTIDLQASSRDVAIFDGSGTYEITVSATGYTNDLKFTLTTGVAEEPTSTATENSTSSATNSTENSTSATNTAPTSATQSSTINSTNGSSNSSSSNNSSSTTGKTVNTGQTSEVISVLMVLMAGGALVSFVVRKKVLKK